MDTAHGLDFLQVNSDIPGPAARRATAGCSAASVSYLRKTSCWSLPNGPKPPHGSPKGHHLASRYPLL